VRWFLPVALMVGCTTPPTAVAISTTETATEARYLALGDSFTAGTGSTPELSFPVRLVSHWDCKTPARLLNLGVDGYTTDDVIDSELPQVRGFAPQVVTLAIGANDIVHGSSSSMYRAHVRQILSAVVATGVRRVVTIPQPDWALSPTAALFGSPPSLHATIVQFNAILRAETEAVDGEFVDLFPLMEQEAEAHMLASDGLHPSAAAYDAWGAALATRVPASCASGS
jgi:acyl-CoA thioesterase I